jgi:CTP synthase (UTP-ammonia lyase)
MSNGRRQPKPQIPSPAPEPTYDAGEVLERIRAVEQENVQRLEDDIAILTKYLKTQDAPKPVIEALEGLSSQQKKSWKTAIEKVEELLEE